MTYLLYTAAAQSLVQLLHDSVDGELMIQFVQTFLLESNATAVRWQVHELLYNMHKLVHVLSVLYCFESFLATERVHMLLFIFLIINAITILPLRSKVQDITFLLAFSKLYLLLWRVCIFLVFGAAVRFFACRLARMLKLRIHRRITGRVKAFIVLFKK